MPGELRASQRPHTAERCQARNPATCTFHGSTPTAAANRGDINAFIDAKTKENSQNASAEMNDFFTPKPSTKNIVAEASKRNGGSLSSEQNIAATAIGKMYESGELKTPKAFGRKSDMLINFNNKIPTINKNGKTIGIVEVGSEGFKYFYEVEGNNVSFRQADGADMKGQKLPLNYGMRKKLDGKGINDTNNKWAAEAYSAAHGI